MLSRSSGGSCWVKPSARPRGMIVTLWTGSASPPTNRATSAWPDSWTAVVRFSFSEMTIERRSAPISTLSLASSKSSASTLSLSRRAAISAASLTRNSRSAPEKPGRAARDDFEIDAAAERDLAGVNLEDADRGRADRARHDDAAIEPARAQQRGIEHVRPVGRSDDDDAVVGLEAVHLDEQLVERLLALVVTAAEAGAAMATDRVDLVDEDDARRVLLALLEQVANAARADADEHLDEVRAADREERHAGLARDRAREQRLAGARRAHHQHALRDPTAEAGELLRILQERDDLFDLVLGFLDAGDVFERHAVLVIAEQLRLATCRSSSPCRRPTAIAA